MAGLSINTKTGRPNAALREGIAARLAEIEDYFDVNDAVKMHSALADVLAYMDECEQVGITPHLADLRSLIAAALGVTA